MADTSYRARPFTPSSLNEASRTVELVAATETPVARESFDGSFLEILKITPRAIDLSRLAGGMPLLDSHRQDGLDRVLGTVLAARIEGKQLIMTVQISERAEGVWRDIRAGIIRSVSIGYGVNAFEDGTDRETGQRVRSVTRWTPMEVSLVPVAADAGAYVRTQDMPTETTPITESATAPAIETRGMTNREIRALVETAGLARALADDLIDRNASVEDARAAISTARLAGSRHTARAESVTELDTPEAFRVAAGEALYARIHPGHKPGERARQYVGMTMPDLARESLRRANIGVMGLSPSDLVTRGLNSTSDYPLLLGDAMNRELRSRYDAAPATLKAVARQTTARDFRAKTKLQISEAAPLVRVGEGAEYRYSAFTESGTSYRVDTYGRIFGLTRQAQVNDDLGAFSDIPGKMGSAAAEFEADFLTTLLVQGSGRGPVMQDGIRLFDIAHGNMAATESALNIVHLSDARLAMRRQTGMEGRPINVRPAFLLVPPELETMGESILAAVQAGRAEDVNPFTGKLVLLVEPRLTDPRRWYVVASPSVTEGLEYAYLQGAEGPQTESRVGFEVDGIEFKVRLDFGAAFIDWRSWYTNAGEAK